MRLTIPTDVRHERVKQPAMSQPDALRLASDQFTSAASRTAVGSHTRQTIHVAPSVPFPTAPRAPRFASARDLLQQRQADEARLAPATQYSGIDFTSNWAQDVAEDAFEAYGRVSATMAREPGGWLTSCASYENRERLGAIYAMPLGKDSIGARPQRIDVLFRWWQQARSDAATTAGDLRSSLIWACERLAPERRQEWFERAKHKGDPEDMLMLSRSVWASEPERALAMCKEIGSVLPRARKRRCSDDFVDNLARTAVEMAWKRQDMRADIVAWAERLIDARFDSKHESEISRLLLALGAFPGRHAVGCLQRFARHAEEDLRFVALVSLICQPLDASECDALREQMTGDTSEMVREFVPVLDAVHAHPEKFCSLDADVGTGLLLLLCGVLEFYPESLSAPARETLVNALLKWSPWPPNDVQEAGEVARLLGILAVRLPSRETHNHAVRWLLEASRENNPWAQQPCDRVLRAIGDAAAIASLGDIRARQSDIERSEKADREALWAEAEQKMRNLRARDASGEV